MGGKKLLALGLCLGLLAFAHEDTKDKKVTIQRPPKSLDNYYPPKDKNLSFVKDMHAMSVAFYGVRVNVSQGDWEKALMWAKQLEEVYVNNSKKVPEWKDHYKPELAKKLVKAVQSKNPDLVAKASKALGETCQKCHAQHQIAVKLYYHFPPYDNIKLEDPVELQVLGVKDYMVNMTNSLKGLIVFLNQGEEDKARDEGKKFVERAKSLTKMCYECHKSEKTIESLAGQDYRSTLEDLQSFLKEQKLDHQKIFQKLSQVENYCYRCHNVHLVPALVRDALK
ncbi:hypothetical protein [Thermocrinis minervae]|uniref:Cytochrome C n=1 Tax=Thermocrinis minervae TaxID=381751 RepID=A0A1M6RH37_9AQUI|nr:hypothetical protein [Thermocrinis minervae]SHK31744.1 hypothetical protein SAMN05444391_0647 [Thermocrinis minervae]